MTALKLEFEEFQSTRPRGARRRQCARRVHRRFVSIHAPARGATPDTLRPAKAEAFQSTRPRGARLQPLDFRRVRSEFQSTRPRGARRNRFRFSCFALHVSIHAPARGATHHPGSSCSIAWFQSTRPRGARRRSCRRNQRERCFNPRAREGRDAPAQKRRRIFDVSIHAPARGATIPDEPAAALAGVSIHAPARGATSATMRLTSASLFQSTRPRGARRVTQYVAGVVEGFNPRAREGRDWSRASLSNSTGSFNPRAREGRDILTTVRLSH